MKALSIFIRALFNHEYKNAFIGNGNPERNQPLSISRKRKKKNSHKTLPLPVLKKKIRKHFMQIFKPNRANMHFIFICLALNAHLFSNEKIKRREEGCKNEHCCTIVYNKLC